MNIGNARLYGLEEDLGLKGNQYQIAVSILFIPYCVSSIPGVRDRKETATLLTARTAPRSPLEPVHPPIHCLPIHLSHNDDMGSRGHAVGSHPELRRHGCLPVHLGRC